MTIDLAGLPAKAVPGQVASDVIWKLAIIDGVAAIIPGLIAASFYARYRIDRASHAETRATLPEWRQAKAAAG